MRINRLITIDRYHFIVCGFVWNVRQPSVQRLGYESWIAFIVPQRIEEAKSPKYIGRRWFTAGKSSGDPLA